MRGPMSVLPSSKLSGSTGPVSSSELPSGRAWAKSSECGHNRKSVWINRQKQVADHEQRITINYLKEWDLLRND